MTRTCDCHGSMAVRSCSTKRNSTPEASSSARRGRTATVAALRRDPRSRRCDRCRGAHITSARSRSAVHVRFQDLDGQYGVVGDPRFRDKVLLVTLAGSWCPNSHDEARLLVQLDRQYRARGLEIVSLMFEQHAEFDRAVAAVQRFRTAYGIAYPTLIAGKPTRRRLRPVLPQLDAVLAYPTAIFIDRTGRVREIHTGFAGPATGVQHDLLAHEFATGSRNCCSRTRRWPSRHRPRARRRRRSDTRERAGRPF